MENVGVSALRPSRNFQVRTRGGPIEQTAAHSRIVKDKQAPTSAHCTAAHVRHRRPTLRPCLPTPAAWCPCSWPAGAARHAPRSQMPLDDRCFARACRCRLLSLSLSLPRPARLPRHREGLLLTSELAGDEFFAVVADEVNAGVDLDRDAPACTVTHSWDVVPGATRLHHAAGEGSLAAVELLLQRGASPGKANEDG